jgi:CxxC-x17-CxxC domain-containing protein
MKKSLKSKSQSKGGSAGAPAVDPYLEGLMAKLLDRLTALERKLDTVIAQTAAAGKSSGGGDANRSFQSQPPQEHPRRDRILYEVICADCQKACEIPFRPAEGRAVYCKECFAKRKSGGSGNSSGFGGSRGPGGPGGFGNSRGMVPLPSKPADNPNTVQSSSIAALESPRKSKNNLPVKPAKKKK